MASIHSLHELNATDPQRYVLFYEDELTSYRRAVVQQSWASRGRYAAIKVNEASPLQLGQAHCMLPDRAYRPAHQSAEEDLSGHPNGSLLPLCRSALSQGSTDLSDLGQLVRAFP